MQTLYSMYQFYRFAFNTNLIKTNTTPAILCHVLQGEPAAMNECWIWNGMKSATTDGT